ncbi:protein-methionine-sulfoxide reductase heme-binding subunit MsrQ [Temperatibacter marinus]|uniref:Protein-methionine-sulfoxide reductase heme-binding subunit MsrQ n=1 Tax=Temperatibacter marinus TaxID=1456591 RepID=A0AA52ED27_9PROT|nr:protein-methionine-sulfoxide reductase heme-binding subunit MsrQ [Temperatibacter marinus]WND01468.1 protein-methionine-sulfoxide reductase heme-binding subunit MsrQ [Temperatibacter marinus]
MIPSYQFRLIVKPLLFFAMAWPGVWVILQWRYARRGLSHELGFNPVEYIHHYTGDWAIYFLLIGLAISPLSRIKQMRQLISMRRMVGLFAAFYVVLHILGYLWLDLRFDMRDFLQDILKRNYITVGVIAFLMLIPLVLTSTKFAMRGMGARAWKRLHTLVYWITGLALMHFFMMRKGFQLEPLIFIGIYLILMSFRWKPNWLKLLFKSKIA